MEDKTFSYRIYNYNFNLQLTKSHPLTDVNE